MDSTDKLPASTHWLTAKTLTFFCLFFLLAQPATGQLLHVYEADKGGRLDITLETAGSIRIVGWDKPEIAIEADFIGKDAESINYDIKEDSDNLIIHSAYDGEETNHSGRVDLDVRVPQEFHVTFSSQGGTIHLENLSGNIEAYTNGGKIYVQDVIGSAQLGTTGAAVHISQFSGDMNVRTTGANIKIDSFEGALSATTTAGDIRAALAQNSELETGDIKLNTTMGDIALQIPENFSTTIDITLAYTRSIFKNYKIKSNIALEETRTDTWDDQFGSPKKFIYGKGLLNEGRHEIQIHTTNGHVKLETVNALPIHQTVSHK